MYVTLPTSMSIVRPVRNARADSRVDDGICSVRRKSPPVPEGKIPSSQGWPDRSIPFATSLIVPSPPQAIINLRPDSAARRARRVPSPAVSVNATENGPKCVRRSLAIADHLERVAPEADFGLTMTYGRRLSDRLTVFDFVDVLGIRPAIMEGGRRRCQSAPISDSTSPTS